MRYRVRVLLALLLGAGAWRQAAAESPAALAAWAAAYTAVAAKGNPATVGIYCRTTAYLSYYGTGVIVSPDGYLLTSTTVVPPGATNIHVHLSDRRRLEGTIVAIDETIESALLKVAATDLPALPLADRLPAVGERAYTFGNAHNMIVFGAGASFSSGVISGVYPVVSIDSQSSYSGLAIETDAAINPGQDGGPLLNSRGQLAGIISLSFSPRRWQGVAVPITLIRERLKPLATGQVRTVAGALLEPLPADGPAARGLAGHARGHARAVIALQVERQYPPEVLPRPRLEDHLQTLKNFATLTKEQQREIAGEFFAADAVLATNQHVRRPAGLVTGVIVAPDGFILTSLFNIETDSVWRHKRDGLRPPAFTTDVAELTKFNPAEYEQVPNPVTKITAIRADGRPLEARVVARHDPLGVALLQVDATDLPWLDFATATADPAVGEPCGVLGVGDDRASYTLNAGMVSAANRHRDYRFQFDGRLNYGNSGGPIFAADGRFLGLALDPMSPGPLMGRLLGPNDVLEWQIAPNSGVSFGARAERLRQALPQLKAGKSTTTFGGAFVGFAPETTSLLDTTVVLGYIVPGSPAASAGLRAGDTLRRFGLRAITSWRDVLDEVDHRQPGDVVEVELERPGTQRYLELNGQRLANGADFERLLQSLADGATVSGRFVGQSRETVKTKITLGER